MWNISRNRLLFLSLVFKFTSNWFYIFIGCYILNLRMIWFFSMFFSSQLNLSWIFRNWSRFLLNSLTQWLSKWRRTTMETHSPEGNLGITIWMTRRIDGESHSFVWMTVNKRIREMEERRDTYVDYQDKFITSILTSLKKLRRGKFETQR